mgnify:CR=1 FL=1
MSLAIRKTVSPVRSDSFNILKSDKLVIGGYASIEMVDKQNDLITLDALNEAVKKYMTDPKFRNVMTNHSNVQVGEVIPSHRDKNGRVWKTSVDDVGFFVVIKMREDIEKAREVGRDIRSGSMRSFSIGGQALSKRKKTHEEHGEYNEIDKLELHEVTICEKGINPEAKFDILKQDKGENMSDIEKALAELNDKLNIIKESEENKKTSNLEKNGNSSENNIKNIAKDADSTNGDTMPEEEITEEMPEEEPMDDVVEDADYMDTNNPNMGDDTEMADGEEEEEEAVFNFEKKDDIPTGQLEAGNAGGYVDEAHPQLDGKYMAKFEDQSTLDLSTGNLEKAYSEFKAEQLEKMAYETVKGKFQKRFDTEMVSKEAEIVKAGYDAQSEVSQLKQQFSDLLKSLTNEKTTVIRKQEEAIEALNIPSSDTIAKMDWSEINQLVNRLENGE